MTPKLTIIVFCFNVERTVASAFNKICNGTRGWEDRVEVIFVDDGSTDDTALRLESILANRDSTLRTKVVKHNSNLGIMESARTGLRNARAEYAVFLAGDGVFDEESIRSLVSTMEQFPDCDAYIGFNPNLRKFYRPIRIAPRSLASDLARLALQWTNPRIYIRRYRLICARVKFLVLVPASIRRYGHGTASLGTLMLTSSTLVWFPMNTLSETVGRSSLGVERVGEVLHAHVQLAKHRRRLLRYRNSQTTIVVNEAGRRRRTIDDE